MKKTDSIYYSGQGCIYRCPECHKVDRAPYDYPPKVYECRFCKKEFEMVSKSDMTPDLYKVIQEINYLETGTVFGASREMLASDNLVKAGKSVGIDVLGAILPEEKKSVYNSGSLPEPKKRDSWSPWRLDKDQLKELMKTKEGKEIFAECKKLMMNAERFEKDDNARLCKEVWEEGRLRVLMKHNKRLTKNAKLALLKDHGFEGGVDKKGKVYVFFGSTYAPECDSYVYWE